MIHPFMLSAAEERRATADDDKWEVEGAKAATEPTMDATMASFILGSICV